MTIYTDEVNIYNPDAIKDGIDGARDAYKAYITEVSADNGIVVAAAGKGTVNGSITNATTGWHLADVLEFIRQGVSRFWIGLKDPDNDTTPTVRIGKKFVNGATDNESHMELDYHSMQLMDKSNSTYFHVSDRLDRGGTCLVTEVFVVGNSNVSVGSVDVYMTPSLHTLHNTGLGSGEIIGVESVQGDGVTFSSERVYDGDIRATPSDLTKLVDGFKITVIYETNSSLAKAYTAGVRSSNPYYSNYPGAMSFAEGVGGVASGTASHVEGVDLGSDYGTQLMSTGLASHAEGINSEASGNGSHAEGFRVAARGIYSHAEGTGTAASGSASHAEGYVAAASGDYSHAEGYETAATGRCSHAEGRDTNARGLASHAQNQGTVALAPYQTVLGTYNVEDAKTITFTGDGNRIDFNFTVASFSDFLSITVDDVDIMQKVTRGTRPYSDGRTLAFVRFKEADTPADGAIIKVKYTPGTYALIIGNGTSDNHRSNALGVKWNGDVDVDNRRIKISDSGWITPKLDSPFVKYSDARTPRYRRLNGMVEIRGGVKPTSTTALNETVHTLFTLPEGYCPANCEVTSLCQGSDRKIWLLTVNLDGTVTATRLRDMGATTYQNATTTEWMMFDVVFAAGGENVS